MFTENGNGIENTENFFCRHRDQDWFLSNERRSGSGDENPVSPDSTFMIDFVSVFRSSLVSVCVEAIENS